MRVSYFASSMLIAGALLGPICAADQKDAKKQAAPARKQTVPTAAQIAALTMKVQEYADLLKNPDVTLNSARTDEVKQQWITASCQLEVDKLPEPFIEEPAFVEGVMAACTKRMQTENPASGGAGAVGNGTAPTKPPVAAADGCSLEDVAKTSVGKTNYEFTVLCTGKVKPGGMVISMTEAKPAVTEEQGKELADSFAAALKTKGQTYDTGKSEATLTLPDGSTPYTSRFEIAGDTTSTEVASAKYFIASTDVKSADSCEATPMPAGCWSGAVKVPVSKAEAEAACPSEIVDTDLDKPTLAAIDPADKSAAITGKLTKAKTGTVQACSDGKVLGKATIENGAFTVPAKGQPALGFKTGEQIKAQYKDTGANWGPSSDVLLVGSCALAAGKVNDQDTVPTLNITVDAKNQATFSGTVKGAKKGVVVRICVNDLPVPDMTATTLDDGKYNGGTKSFKVNENDKVLAQTCAMKDSVCGTPYGPVSATIPIKGEGLMAGNATDPNKPVVILIGGVEYAGYSSEAQTTDGFLDIYYQGPKSKKGLTGWGRIRLTSAAQPATNGVVSLISNPTGLTTFNYANVGQVLDYVAGPSLTIPKTHYWSFIGEFGAITPLSSQSVPVSFVAPAPGTLECMTLVNRFSAKNGYNPALMLNTAPNATTCLAGGYADVAFANQDRSNFLLKYGAGVRTWYPFGDCKTAGASDCSNVYGALDMTLGQDSSVTGGVLRGVVFKLDGLLPIPTGKSSWLYLFGSAYIRLRANQNFAPLILQSPTSPVTIPSPNVVVLPLVQPNRDYYRLGVGLNINQLWCKTFGSGCSNPTPDATAGDSTPTITKVDPPNGTAKAKKPLAITVTGKNFSAASKLQWNGVIIDTAYVSATELKATISTDKLASAGTVKLTVDNTDTNETSTATSYTIK